MLLGRRSLLPVLGLSLRLGVGLTLRIVGLRRIVGTLRHVVGLRRLAVAPAELGQRIALPDQAGELGQGIAGAGLPPGPQWLRARPRWLGRAPARLAGAIGS